MLVMTILPVFVSCASEPVTVKPVGPAPVSGSNISSTGSLQVFSATETHQIGENCYYYPHTGYKIFSESGKLLRYIPNHSCVEDETPSYVSLPAGHYTVKAESIFYPTVMVPVIIKEGRMTQVHLDSDRKLPANASEDQIVRLPDGRVVGWNGTN